MLVRLPFRSRNLLNAEKFQPFLKQLQQNSAQTTLTELPVDTNIIQSTLARLFGKTIQQPQIRLVSYELLSQFAPKMVAAYSPDARGIYVAKEVVQLANEPTYPKQKELQKELTGFLLHELIHLYQDSYGIVPLGVHELYSMEIEAWVNQIRLFTNSNAEVWEQLAETLNSQYGPYYAKYYNIPTPSKEEFLKAIHAYLSLIS